MAKGTISINSDNILPIIKKWLYSDKDIFLRELISNSCDAINKLKFLKENFSKNFRIDVNIDKTKKTLTITDNGIASYNSMSCSERNTLCCISLIAVLFFKNNLLF